MMALVKLRAIRRGGEREEEEGLGELGIVGGSDADDRDEDDDVDTQGVMNEGRIALSGGMMVEAGSRL
jgi:hypothetical protein